MITREEIDVLFQEKMNGNVLDILVQDCCNVIKGKLNYKKEYLDKEDLLFLLARLYYLDCDFREYILEIYDTNNKPNDSLSSFEINIAPLGDKS